MSSIIADADRGFVELINRYEKWRRIAAFVGQTTPDEPTWEDKRLCFRYGYPYDGWSGYVIEPHNTGYNLLSVTTERRAEPAEYLDAYFSRLQDAGKYIIWNNGESVRMHCKLPPVTPRWRAEGLDPRVEKVVLSDKTARYSLKTDHETYFEAFAGGIKPENRLLALSYDELDAILLGGMPESILTKL